MVIGRSNPKYPTQHRTWLPMKDHIQPNIYHMAVWYSSQESQLLHWAHSWCTGCGTTHDVVCRSQETALWYNNNLIHFWCLPSTPVIWPSPKFKPILFSLQHCSCTACIVYILNFMSFEYSRSSHNFPIKFWDEV